MQIIGMPVHKGKFAIVVIPIENMVKQLDALQAVLLILGKAVVVNTGTRSMMWVSASTVNHSLLFDFDQEM